MRFGAIFGVGVTLLLAGCQTPYQEQGLLGGVHAQRLDSQTAVITAKGNAYTGATTVRLYAIRRAAEETLADGFDWFSIDGSQDISRSGTIVHPGTYTSNTTADVSAVGNTAYGTATTTGFSTPGSVQTYIKPGQEVVIHMFKGEKPSGSQGFVAREVLSYLVPPTKPKT